MGSKRKLAVKIVDKIIAENPDADTFYDLFGGGAAVSMAAIQSGHFEHVIYNDLNTGVCNLLRKLQQDGVTDEFYEWISREKFNELKRGDCWKSGLAKVCWSFGNDQKGYLFGEHIEEVKKNMHDAVVSRCQRSADKASEFYKIDKINLVELFDEQNSGLEELFGETSKRELTVNERRMRMTTWLRRQQHLHGCGHIRRIQHLERLEPLHHLPNINILNKSYNTVEIKGKAVIYLDPPYKGTGEYQEKVIHDEIDKYIRKSEYPVYVSSYHWDDLKLVESYEHRTTFSPNANNKTIENLYKGGTYEEQPDKFINILEG